MSAHARKRHVRNWKVYKHVGVLNKMSNKRKRSCSLKINLNLTPPKKLKKKQLCLRHTLQKSEKSEKTSTFSQKSRETVYKAAQIGNDTHVIAMLEACGDDLLETEYGFHRKCYQEYTHVKALKKIVKKNNVKEQSQDKAGSSHESETRSSNRKADRGGLFEK